MKFDYLRADGKCQPTAISSNAARAAWQVYFYSTGSKFFCVTQSEQTRHRPSLRSLAGLNDPQNLKKQERAYVESFANAQAWPGAAWHIGRGTRAFVERACRRRSRS